MLNSYKFKKRELTNKRQLKYTTKTILQLIIISIVITNLSILLNIPFLRPFLGYVYVTLLPGFIILLIFKNKFELSDIVLFSIGLSLAFLMIVGFITDFILYVILDIQSPLSIEYILPSLNLTIVIMLFILYVTKLNDFIIISYNPFKFNDLSLLIVAVLLPPISFTGVHYLKEFNNNHIIHILILLIFLYIILLGLINVRISDLTYMYIIFLISISLLILVFFRTNYIYVSDAIAEYNLFNMVLNEGHYYKYRNTYSNLGVCLSITVLPTIYCIILGIIPNTLFKLVYLLPFSLTPIITYKVARKLLSPNYSFISSIYLISQASFLYQISAFRTYLSIFFFSMAILSLVSPILNQSYTRVICLIFVLSGIFSHYSNTVIMFIIFLFTFVFTYFVHHVSTRHNISILCIPYKGYVISTKFILIFFILIFLWYAQITENAFDSIVSFIIVTLNRFHQSFLLESLSPEVSAAIGLTLTNSPTPILKYIVFLINWTCIIFTAVGVIFSLLYILNVKVIAFKYNTFRYFLMNTTGDVIFIILLSSICAFLFGLSVITPFVFQGYSLGRTYYQVIVFLSIFFTIGGLLFANYVKFSIKNQHYIMFLVLIIYFANSLGVLDELVERPSSMILNPPQLIQDPRYIYDVEESSINWMTFFSDADLVKFSDVYGSRKIHQIGLIHADIYIYDSLIERSYIYLTYDNLIKNIVYMPTPTMIAIESNFSVIKNLIENKSIIYVNGGSSVLC